MKTAQSCEWENDMSNPCVLSLVKYIPAIPISALPDVTSLETASPGLKRNEGFYVSRFLHFVSQINQKDKIRCYIP